VSKAAIARRALVVVIAIGALAGAVAVAPVPAAARNGPYEYYAVTPCRAVDTRYNTGVNGSPRLSGNAAARNFQIQGVCGVPVGAKAVTINVTIVTPSSTGFLTLWPSGGAMPVVSTLDFGLSDNSLANGAIVPLSTNADDLSVFMGGGTGSTDVLIDVTGYFM
jgi:hypothetical protein